MKSLSPLIAVVTAGCCFILSIITVPVESAWGSPEDFETSSLYRAVIEDRPDKVSQLLSEGVDINIRDKYGSTPLHTAVACGNGSIVNLLIERGADVNAGNDAGDTPLHTAVQRMFNSPASPDIVYKNIIETLIGKGANINAKNAAGDTPLHLVCSGMIGTEGIITMLVKKGADVNAKNRSGETPMDRCFHYKETLRKFGGKTAKELTAEPATKAIKKGR